MDYVKVDYRKQTSPEKLLDTHRIEEKYYITLALLKAVSDGNVSKALEHLGHIFHVLEEYEETLRFKQFTQFAQEMNILLCHEAHSHKVHPLYCENTCQVFREQLAAPRDSDSVWKLLCEMVDVYCTLIRQQSRLRNSNLIRSCLEYMDSYYSEPLTLAGEAHRLSVSPSYLSARFVKETGMTFVEYLTHIRLRYACQLLEGLQMPIQQVAEWSGFSSSNYFARVFKAKMGVSPTQYRISHQSNPFLC